MAQSSKELLLRVAAGTPTGLHSATLRIWSPSTKSDVYASVRARAGDIKISLHGSGVCNAGLTEPFARKEQRAVVDMGGSRHQSTWKRKTHVGSTVVVPLQFFLPFSELQRWSTVPQGDVTWIQQPEINHSIVITCAFSGQISERRWSEQAMDQRLLARRLLPNGEVFWVSWQQLPTSPLERRMIRYAAAKIRTPGGIEFSGAESPKEDPRILIFQELPEEQKLVVIEARGTAPSAS